MGKSEDWVAFIRCVCKVNKFFNGNIEKTCLWFTISNPLIGNIEPLLMVENGRAKKLERFINSSLSGERP
jgi:hypothetical protein